jgi:hypothetical protein
MVAVALLAAAAPKPAAGAALDQVAIATAGALAASVAVLWLIGGHRRARGGVLERAAGAASRVAGLPAWAALPTALATSSLMVALLGMYWDIALHIDEGRDAGPLANPAHYLILAGLYGVFCAGVLAMALPRSGERPGPAPVRLAGDWWAPVGGILMAAAGAFALVGFPLDDIWHRLFGQDVTLWGPTHLMLIGGAGMTLIGQAVLVAEGLAARPGGGRARVARVVALRRVALMGGLLIGLSTFQGEFDFGVPQFRLVLHPFLIAVAAGIALVAGRLWSGPGGALGAALFFLLVRGIVSLVVGPVLGETTPALPLYLAEAVCVELVALVLLVPRAARPSSPCSRRPLAFGAAAGLLAGTAGMAVEWLWSGAVMDLPWNGDILPEGLLLAAVGGTAAGVIGALLGQGLRGELPRPAVARGLVVVAGAALSACLVDGLVTEPAPAGATAQIGLRGERATVRIEPGELAADPAWITVTAWQGGGLRVDRLRRTGPATFATTEPVPLRGEWKAMVRLQSGRHVLAAPVFMPGDAAIPVPPVPARPQVTRALRADHEVLQRERKRGVAGWLWLVAGSVVLALALAFVAALCWGVGRVARATARGWGSPTPQATRTDVRPREPTTTRRARRSGPFVV